MKKFSILAFGLLILLNSKITQGSLLSHSRSDTINKPDFLHNEEDLQVFRDVVYSVKPSLGKMQYTSGDTRAAEIGKEELSILMDIAIPPKTTQPALRPLVILVHGGGFITGSKTDHYKTMLSYARGGFVSSTINYRLTRDRGSRGSAQNLLGIRKATEDLMNAIRYLKANSEKYSIDTNRIATIGFSAGGVLSLLNALDYNSQQGIVSDFPGISSRVKAAISSGAALPGELKTNPNDPKSVLTYDRTDTPVQVFHANPKDGGASGKLWVDTVVPFQKLVNASGNTCEIVAQPNLTHTVDLSLEGPYWKQLKPFLTSKLQLKNSLNY